MDIIEAFLLPACTVTVALGGAWAVVSRLAKPLVDDHRRIEKLEVKVDGILENCAKHDDANIAVMTALCAILAHLETRNATGEMRSARADLQKYMIERGKK
jgi:hypothetical protein